MSMPYQQLLGPEPRVTFLLAVVSKRVSDFPDLEDVYPQGRSIVVKREGGKTAIFRIPMQFQADVAMMDDILTSGMSENLEAHIAEVLHGA